MFFVDMSLFLAEIESPQSVKHSAVGILEAESTDSEADVQMSEKTPHKYKFQKNPKIQIRTQNVFYLVG